jgi:outer membrane translocation and assembly module TamA
VKAAGLKSGEPVDFDAVGEGRARIRRLLEKNGYMRGETRVERAIDDAARKVNLLIKVESGPLFHFGTLKLVGLDILTEPAVRKLWGLKPGQPFDAGYPEYFLDRIREDGLFDNLGKTRSSIAVRESDHSVDVTLYFGETARKSLLPGI